MNAQLPQKEAKWIRLSYEDYYVLNELIMVLIFHSL